MYTDGSEERNSSMGFPRFNPPPTVTVVSRDESQVRFGSTVDWNCPELSPHAQVLSDYSHQRHASHIDQPPGQSGREMRVIDPAADHVEEVHGDCEVQALFPSTDEEPETESTGQRVQDEGHHWEPALQGSKTQDFVAEHLVQWAATLYESVHPGQPQAQEAVVDALHEHDLTHDEDRVPDVAAEVGHGWLVFHAEAWRTLTAGHHCYQLAHPGGLRCDLKTWEPHSGTTAGGPPVPPEGWAGCKQGVNGV